MKSFKQLHEYEGDTENRGDEYRDNPVGKIIGKQPHKKVKKEAAESPNSSKIIKKKKNKTKEDKSDE